MQTTMQRARRHAWPEKNDNAFFFHKTGYDSCFFIYDIISRPVIARAKNYVTISQCSSLKTAIGLPQCYVIILHVHFSNDAKTIFGLTCFCFLIQDPDTFAFAWQKTGTSEGCTQLRYNYYPMISDLSEVKPGQIRCGEHTDYGGITLLFQDDVGRLEVRDRET